MNVFKNLKSIFIVDNENKNNEADSKPTIKINNDNAIDPIKNEVIESNSIPLAEGILDNKIIETLFQAIENNNIKGFDYLEFKQAVRGMEKMVTDEATRFKSAFSTASTIGVTMNNLVETAEYYQKILDKEKDQFIKAAEEQSNNLIENRKKELQLLLKTLADKQSMIEQFKEELNQGEAKIKGIQEGINNATLKIENTTKNFNVSFQYIRDQITTDIDKIKTYLK